jgi:hypothetical protein
MASMNYFLIILMWSLFSNGIIYHLLTGYEGNSTFFVPKVPTILRGNAEGNSWYRGDNKSVITRISSLLVFYYTEQLCNSKF